MYVVTIYIGSLPNYEESNHIYEKKEPIRTRLKSADMNLNSYRKC
jgi:hypothetical protein